MPIDLQPIVFRGRLAAAAGGDRYFLSAGLESLEPDHPDRLFVSVMCFHAHDVMTGQVAGPYRDEQAELTARATLIPDRDFGSLADRPDCELAEIFGVPLDQVAAKRRDLVRPERPRPSARR